MEKNFSCKFFPVFGHQNSGIRIRIDIQPKMLDPESMNTGPFIPDPTFFHPGSELSPSRIPDPQKNLSILTPKKVNKWFLGSKKYDPGCSFRIPDPDADFLPSRIPDPGVKKAPNPGSRIRNTVKKCWNMFCSTMPSAAKSFRKCFFTKSID